jgi:hypothetical protein
MPRRLAASLAALVLVAGVAGCATHASPRSVAPPDAPREFESWPPADVARTVAPPARDPNAPVVRLAPKEGGYRIEELFALAQKTLGVSILFDSTNATFKQAKVEFVGEHVVGRDQFFPWLQAVLSYRKLVLVPVGPKSPDGAQQWLVMDQADPNLKSRPVFIDEGDVFDYADRDGLYVVTTMRVRDTVDTTRVRNALSPLSTQTAGIGRIQDLPGSFLVVGDFAPVVAAMKRILDRINAETTRSFVPPTPPAAK